MSIEETENEKHPAGHLSSNKTCSNPGVTTSPDVQQFLQQQQLSKPHTVSSLICNDHISSNEPFPESSKDQGVSLTPPNFCFKLPSYQSNPLDDEKEKSNIENLNHNNNTKNNSDVLLDMSPSPVLNPFPLKLSRSRGLPRKNSITKSSPSRSRRNSLNHSSAGGKRPIPVLRLKDLRDLANSIHLKKKREYAKEMVIEHLTEHPEESLPFTIDSDTEQLLLDLADDFISDITLFAYKLSALRRYESLDDVGAVQLYLEKTWNLRIPGFGYDENRNAKRLFEDTHVHCHNGMQG